LPTLGFGELLFFDSVFGVMDRTFPAFVSEPCEGKISPHSCFKTGLKQKETRKSRAGDELSREFPLTFYPVFLLLIRSSLYKSCASSSL